jgi:hypothetical protein
MKKVDAKSGTSPSATQTFLLSLVFRPLKLSVIWQNLVLRSSSPIVLKIQLLEK